MCFPQGDKPTTVSIQIGIGESPVTTLRMVARPSDKFKEIKQFVGKRLKISDALFTCNGYVIDTAIQRPTEIEIGLPKSTPEIKMVSGRESLIVPPGQSFSESLTMLYADKVEMRQVVMLETGHYVIDDTLEIKSGTYPTFINAAKEGSTKGPPPKCYKGTPGLSKLMTNVTKDFYVAQHGEDLLIWKAPEGIIISPYNYPFMNFANSKVEYDCYKTPADYNMKPGDKCYCWVSWKSEEKGREYMHPVQYATTVQDLLDFNRTYMEAHKPDETEDAGTTTMGSNCDLYLVLHLGNVFVRTVVKLEEREMLVGVPLLETRDLAIEKAFKTSLLHTLADLGYVYCSSQAFKYYDICTKTEVPSMALAFVCGDSRSIYKQKANLITEVRDTTDMGNIKIIKKVHPLTKYTPTYTIKIQGMKAIKPSAKSSKNSSRVRSSRYKTQVYSFMESRNHFFSDVEQEIENDNIDDNGVNFISHIGYTRGYKDESKDKEKGKSKDKQRKHRKKSSLVLISKRSPK